MTAENRNIYFTDEQLEQVDLDPETLDLVREGLTNHGMALMDSISRQLPKETDLEKAEQAGHNRGHSEELTRMTEMVDFLIEKAQE